MILTEGDSAKTLAVAGLGVIGRDYYGVYPLKASRSITYWVSQNLVTRGKFKNEFTEGKNEKRRKLHQNGAKRLFLPEKIILRWVGRDGGGEVNDRNA